MKVKATIVQSGFGQTAFDQKVTTNKEIGDNLQELLGEVIVPLFRALGYQQDNIDEVLSGQCVGKKDK